MANSILVLLLVSVELCWYASCVEGLEFLLNNISIPTNGSGRILVTDIGYTDAEALICQLPSEGGRTDWYLDPEDENATSIADADRIDGDNYRGWTRNRATRDGNRIVRLKRVSDTAVEGRFTCRIAGDSDSPRGLLILHPITSVTTTSETIEVVSRGNTTFRVRCTSTGGRVLNMSVTGPDFNSDLSNIQAVGTQMWMGNDSYSATTGNITGGNDTWQSYNCTASNGVSSPTERASPEGVTVENILKPLSVRVSWQAVEDADRYTVTFTKAEGQSQEGPCKTPHSASISVATLEASIAVGQDVRSDVTTMLRAYTTYFITVVAENDVLGISNGSDPITLTTQETSAAEPPQNVTIKAVQSSTISVKWNGVSKCRYINGLIVMFRVQYSAEPNGTMQEIEIDVKYLYHKWNKGASTSLTGLTPYTNYSIQVAAQSLWGYVGPYSNPIMAQTDEDTPGPVVITSVPSLSKITITWNKPVMPNGKITHYEVYYGSSFLPAAINTTTSLNTSFTTPGHLELGTELFFTVRAYTRVGGGNSTSVTVSTLTKPSAVEGVMVKLLTITAVNVSWNALIIPDFAINSYTVVYSPASQNKTRKNEEMTAVFPGSVTSGVITGLEPAVKYRFQVFATVTVDGISVEGEWSEPAIIASGSPGEYESCSTHIIIGVAISIISVVVGSSGLIIGGVIAVKNRVMSKTPAYGVSMRCAETVKEVQSSLVAPKEAVYMEVF